MKPFVDSRFHLVLRHHPALQLTPWQEELHRLSFQKPRGWQNQLARRRGVTRQAITNTVRVLRRKIEAATDFIRLSDGAVRPVFEKYTTGWATAPIRTLLWDMLRPKQGKDDVRELRDLLLSVQKQVFNEATDILDRQMKLKYRTGALDHQQLSLGYNMLISSAHIQSNRPDLLRIISAISSDTAKSSWLVYRFFERAQHLFDHQACEAHRQWLKEKIAIPDEEGARFARYALTYYGGTSSATAMRFLQSDGEIFEGAYAYAPVLSRLYKNMQIPRYDSPTWDDINFLRIVLLLQHLPLGTSALPAGSKNALLVLCQQAQHSRDLFVANHAELMLHKFPRS